MSVIAARRIAPIRLEAILNAILWGIALAVPLIMWLSEVGNPLAYWQLNTPPGQKLYTLSKLCGLLSVGLMWLQLVSKFGAATPGLREYSRQSLKEHRVLGMWVLAVLTGHALLFFSAVSVRAEHLVLKVLGPNFTVDFFTTAVSLGVTAFYLLILGAISAVLFLKSRKPFLKWLHRLVCVSFTLGAVHSVLIGSETRSTLALVWYSILISSVLVLAFSYLFKRTTRR